MTTLTFIMSSNNNNNNDPIVSIGTKLEDNNAKDEGSTNLLEAKPLASDSAVSANPHIPSVSASAVLGESATMPADTPQCRGHEFQVHSNDSSTLEQQQVLDALMQSFATTGFQATNLALAIDQIRQMRAWRQQQAMPQSHRH